MNRSVLFWIIALGFCISTSSFAQILDDDYPLEPETAISYDDNTTPDDHEELFDEMFGDYEETLPENNKASNSFDEIAKDIADNVDTSNFKSNTKEVNNDKIASLEGELLIGVSQGGFKLFKDMMGRTKCSFGVTLKSTLNRDLKTLALRLIYKHGAFAFIFKNVKPGASDEHFITTMGDICYNLEGAPDIEINRCRIIGSREDDCMQRLKWDDKILSPNPSVNENY